MGRPHPNIIPLLAAYQHGSSFNFVFPWADGDLLSYWRIQKNHLQAAEHEKMLTQLRGVTDAVGHIHSDRPARLAGIDPHREYRQYRHRFCRHGDIKPSNILWFEETDSDILMLTDFGFR